MAKEKYFLGLEIGANSLGWAAVRVDEQEEPVDILDMGVRIFNPGRPIDTNDPQTPAAQRRAARMARRLIARRKIRKYKTFAILRKVGFIQTQSYADWVGALPNYDHTLYQKYKNDPECTSQNVCYYLRKKALDKKLELEELARVFYHLAQRRGFLSNRKSLKQISRDQGVVKKAITELEKDMASYQARTLGEYLVKISLTPQKRIRNRYTSREMYKEEFEAIFSSSEGFILISSLMNSKKSFLTLSFTRDRSNPRVILWGIVNMRRVHGDVPGGIGMLKNFV